MNPGLAPELGLAGTVPFHNYYVMLHSRDPPREFPKVVSSPLQKALQLSLAPSNGLVNFSWSRSQSLPPFPSSTEEEVFFATAFSKDGNVFELENLTLSNVQDTVQRIISPNPTPWSDDAVKPLYIYVCTHTARDCRCGDIGGLVAKAFREEIYRRMLTSVVKLGETGHVGGHKYAANVLVYPKGEWLGNVKPVDVPEILDKALAGHAIGWDKYTAPPLVSNHWRGRMGLEKERQLSMATAYTS